MELQDKICHGLEVADGKAKFKNKIWKREVKSLEPRVRNTEKITIRNEQKKMNDFGGGKTRIIENGNVFEKGGVNFSAVYGACPNFLKQELGLLMNENADFYASGVSIVIHPQNPFIPIIHCNVRYIEAGNVNWFGGGIDLTPHYINKEEASGFHKKLKAVCDGYDETCYLKFKKWADDYFYLKHRNETRGVGGIFFDKLTSSDNPEKEKIFEFVKSVGEFFLPAYIPIVKKNKNRKYTSLNKQWQLLRRGRYVEFNLLYDRGTKFGLMTDGRTESILMSLPPLAAWDNTITYKKSGQEYATLKMLKKGVKWIL